MGEPASKELIALTELLGYKIMNEIKNKESLYFKDNISKLNSKQQTVLQHLASGKTEMAVAIEMKLNIGTIKYHKLNAFKKLGANCTIEAIIKALKSNQISLDNIDI
jgi:DNA-binding NarL/FixJ family response regulator